MYKIVIINDKLNVFKILGPKLMAGIAQKSLSLIFIVVPQMGGGGGGVIFLYIYIIE